MNERARRASLFRYTAKASDGRTLKGTLEADSEAAVAEALHGKGLTVVRIDGQARSAGSPRGKRVKLDDLAVFSRQLATLVDAGIPIVGGLEAVAEQMENPKLREVVLKVRDDVEGGASLTDAIARQDRVFSPLFVSLVRAGEISGHLAEVLERLATYLEKSAALARKVRSACVYPAIVAFMAAAITTFLLITVVPSFEEIFTTMGVALPLPTRILLATSRWLQRLFLPGLGGLFLGVWLFRRYVLGRPKGRLLFDRTLLNLKIVGPIVRKVVVARFARTLATLVRSGVQILSALEIVAQSAGNRVVSDAVFQVRASIREGENIADPLAASRAFPPMVVRMIAVGEQTGRLDEMLTKIADFYEEQVDAAVAGLSSTIEPVIIVVLGVVIGSIVLAIFMPIFQMVSVMGRM